MKRISVCFGDGSRLSAHGMEDAVRVAGWSGNGEHVYFEVPAEQFQQSVAELRAALDKKVTADLNDPSRSAACFG
jgi:hypothetical protein